MTSLSIRFHVDLDMASETPSILMLEAARRPEQPVHESKLFAPVGVDLEPYKDIYGNPSRRGILPAGYVGLDYEAVLDTDDHTGLLSEIDTIDMPPASTLPAEALHFLLPSRYCPSDDLESVARDLFGARGPGAPRVQRVVEWIHEKVRYAYGTSDSATTAIHTFLGRSGVCRDFAHLGIALCRGIGIPARYVSGYCLGLEPPDLHAYFQVYLDGRWISCDATSDEPRPALARIGIGRDAADCAWSTFYGRGTTTFMSVVVEEAGR
jgi:transglutaminase-like putative cysteine protease